MARHDVITISAVTATPYADASALEVLNMITTSTTATSSIQLTRGR